MKPVVERFCTNTVQLGLNDMNFQCVELSDAT
jgi:hypothetical protein